MLVKATQFKATTAGSGKAGAIFNLGDITAEAQAIIGKAKQQAQELIEQKKQEVAGLRQQAQQQGQEQGYQQGWQKGQEEGTKQGLEEARKEFQERSGNLIAALNGFQEQFAQVKNQILFEAEQQTVGLAVAIAEKVIKKAGIVCREIAGENVKAALELISTNTDIVVKVNPQDLEHLQKMMGQEYQMNKYKHINLEGDSKIEPGGCLVENEQGKVDGQLGKQIERIAENMLANGQGRVQEEEAESRFSKGQRQRKEGEVKEGEK